MELNFDELQQEINEYMSNEEIEKVHKAYYFAKNAHEGQVRKSGEPFIVHPVAVSIVLAQLKLPTPVIIAGLLHDTIEDTDVTYIELEENFGQEIAYIVDGVTKLGEIQGLSNDFVRAENHRKIILSAAKDTRVLLVKLADRVHNMRTIKFMNSAKQKLIANETLEVYAPIAHRLGMYQIKWELEDLSFKCINPESYEEIAKKINMKRADREDVVNEIVEDTLRYLQENDIDAELKGRSKHIFSIYQKISKQQKDFDELTDLFAFRIIVNTIPECYVALGLIHEKYKPIPMRFKDYIPTPKHNMYQSIHTTVISDSGFPVEFQIRTKEMDLTAEYGIASHWMYKEGETAEMHEEIEKRLPWLKQAEEVDTNDAVKFMHQVKLDYFSKNVIVYTPKGDVVEIPEGSTVLDFGYYIHTNVGNTAVSAKVNDRVVSIFYKLNIGDIVQIITNDSAQPSLSYIQKVKTTRAKEALRKYFKDAEKRQIQVEGRKLLIKFAVDNNIFDIKDTLDNNYQDLIKFFSVTELSTLYYRIATGDIDLKSVIDFLKDEKIAETFETDVLIDNNPDITDYKMCRLCSPVAGDEIVATKVASSQSSTKYIVHRKNCQTEEIISAKFTPNAQQHMYITRLQLEILDEPQSISNVLGLISNLHLNITSVFFRAGIDKTALGRVSIEIANKDQLDGVVSQILNLENVLNVERTLEKE